MLGGGLCIVIAGGTLIVRAMLSPGFAWVDALAGGALVGVGASLVKAGCRR